MYQDRTIHVLGDETSDLALMDQLVCYADIMDSEVSLLGHINSGLFQNAEAKAAAIAAAEDRSQKVLKYLHKQQVKTGKHELTVQSLTNASGLFAQNQSADCISLNLYNDNGRLRGPKKAIANRVEQNVLLLRNAGIAPPKTILCPVDASPASAKGMRQALMLANAWNAKLVLLAVLGTPRLYASPSFGLEYPISYQQIEAHIDNERKVIAAFISRHVPDINAVEVEYLQDSVASEGIVAYGKEHADAFLVLGVAARDRFASAILGNTAFKIAVNAVNTTLLVRNNSY